MDKQKRRKKLNGTDTLAMLKRIERVAVPLEELKNIQLCEKTVARYILKKTKSLFLASSCTDNHTLTHCLETAYYEAFNLARRHAVGVESTEEKGSKLQHRPSAEAPDWFARLMAANVGSPQSTEC